MLACLIPPPHHPPPTHYLVHTSCLVHRSPRKCQGVFLLYHRPSLIFSPSLICVHISHISYLSTCSSSDLHESVKVCFYCTQVLQQIQRYHLALAALHALLDNTSNNNDHNSNNHNNLSKTTTSSSSPLKSLPSLYSNGNTRPRSAPTRNNNNPPSRQNPLSGHAALNTTAFPPFIIPPQPNMTTSREGE